MRTCNALRWRARNDPSSGLTVPHVYSLNCETRTLFTQSSCPLHTRYSSGCTNLLTHADTDQWRIRNLINRKGLTADSGWGTIISAQSSLPFTKERCFVCSPQRHTIFVSVLYQIKPLTLLHTSRRIIPELREIYSPKSSPNRLPGKSFPEIRRGENSCSVSGESESC